MAGGELRDDGFERGEHADLESGVGGVDGDRGEDPPPGAAVEPAYDPFRADSVDAQPVRVGGARCISSAQLSRAWLIPSAGVRVTVRPITSSASAPLSVAASPSSNA